MEKYFIVRPSDFWRYGPVDLNGDYEHVDIEDFDLDPRFNCLMFKVPFTALKNGMIVPGSEATEITTGSKFEVSFFRNSNMEYDGKIKSNKRGLYSKRLSLKDVLCKSSKISGMVNYLRDDEDLLYLYKEELEDMYEYGRYFKQEHDETVNGPSKSSVRGLKRARGYKTEI